VAGAPTGGVTALHGRVLDAGQYAQGIIAPVVNATVKLHSSAVSARTDADGYFTLSGIPHGEQLVQIDGSTATVPSGQPRYIGVREPITLYAGVTNEPETPYFLARIDSNGIVDIPVSREFTLSNPPLGVSLSFTSNSVRREGGLGFFGDISLSEIPASLASLPPFLGTCRVLSVSPIGLDFTNPVEITFPNLDNLPPGSAVDFWGVDRFEGGVTIVGRGVVSADGAVITTVSGGLTQSGYFTMAPVPPATAASADHNADNVTPTALNDGNFATTYTLPSYNSLGEDRALTFVYNSTAASPEPIVAGDATLLEVTGVPGLVQSRLEVGGVDVSGAVYTSTSQPAQTGDSISETADETIRQALSFDAASLATGTYPYRLSSAGRYGCSSIAGETTGRVLVQNEIESPFGAGWTLAGLQRLHIQEDGRLVLTEGDGSALSFEPAPVGEKFLSPSSFPVQWPAKGEIADIDGDGDRDVAVTSAEDGSVAIGLNDGTGGFTKAADVVTGVPVQRPQPPATTITPDTADVALADFNRDGILDLAAANQRSDNATVHLGLGGGAFGTPTATLVASDRPKSIAAADFDRDGDPDLAVGSSFGFAGSTLLAQVEVFWNDGTGQFPTKTRPVFNDDTPFDLAVADFNGDGTPDLASAESSAVGEFISASSCRREPGSTARPGPGP
jgi:hypothetical protein